MSRRFPVYSQRTFLREALAALVPTNMETADPHPLLEDCWLALIVEEMCAIVQVQGRAGYRHQGTVLEQALVAIERTVYQPSPEHWRVYWPQVRERLKQPASQLEELQARLIHPLQRLERPECERVEVAVEVPFELLHLPELGLLVTVPAQERCDLDLERVQAREDWVVSGEYYPFEIQVAEWTVVVSSAGEAIIWVRNFPDSLIQQAREVLKEVAQTLYHHRLSPFRAQGEKWDDSNLSQFEREGK